MNSTANTNLLPCVPTSETQKMRHANAFGGSAVEVTFGTGINGWRACVGTEIEVC